MKTLRILLVTIVATTLLNCKDEPKAFNNFQYGDKGTVLNCENLDTKLYNEALFAFESDMIAYYGNRANNNGNELRSYSAFIREAINGRAKYTEIVTPHTVEVFEALKNDTELWNVNNVNSNLKYDSAFFKCIAANIQNNDLKRTLDALLTTNSMSPKLFGAPLQTAYSQATRDKYLATYIAFDLFYAKLFDVDLSQIKTKESQTTEPTSEAELSDTHAGHNH